MNFCKNLKSTILLTSLTILLYSKNDSIDSTKTQTAKVKPGKHRILTFDIQKDMASPTYSKQDALKDLKLLMEHLSRYYNLKKEIDTIESLMRTSKLKYIKLEYIAYNPNLKDELRKNYADLISSGENPSPETLREIYAITQAKIDLINSYLLRTADVTAKKVRDAKLRSAANFLENQDSRFHRSSIINIVGSSIQDHLHLSHTTEISRVFETKKMIQMALSKLELVQKLILLLLGSDIIYPKQVSLPKFAVDVNVLDKNRKMVNDIYAITKQAYKPLRPIAKPIIRDGIKYQAEVTENLGFFTFAAIIDLLPEGTIYM